MTTFRNEPVTILVADKNDLTCLGLTSDQSVMVVSSGWTIVNAPRPLTAVWTVKTGRSSVSAATATGLVWEAPRGVTGVHFAAGDPEGILRPTGPNDAERTLGWLWNRDDATPVAIIDKNDLSERVTDHLRGMADDYDMSYDVVREDHQQMFGEHGDWIIPTARNYRLFDRHFL